MFKRKKIKGFINDELTGRVIVDLHKKYENIIDIKAYLSKDELNEFYKYRSLCLNGWFYYEDKEEITNSGGYIGEAEIINRKYHNEKDVKLVQKYNTFNIYYHEIAEVFFCFPFDNVSKKTIEFVSYSLEGIKTDIDKYKIKNI